MANPVILSTILISIMATLISGQSPQQDAQQDAQQQSGSCSCPCNSGFLTGPPGPPGPPGVGLPGVLGPQGMTGRAGDPGTNGVPGVPGQSGSPGLKGEKGDIGQGSIGQPGNPGPKGDQGLDGIPGPKGTPGEVGLMGMQGQKGTAGQTGVKGDKGEAGTSYVPPVSAFSARRINTLHVTSGSEIITFEEEDIDVGNDFESGTGVFTCRIQGLYYFSFTFLPSRTPSYVFLEQNGVTKAKAHYNANNFYLMQSQSVILSLEVGDEVTLRAKSPAEISYSSRFENIFNGYLIHAT